MSVSLICSGPLGIAEGETEGAGVLDGVTLIVLVMDAVALRDARLGVTVGLLVNVGDSVVNGLAACKARFAIVTV